MPLCGFNRKMLDGLRQFGEGLFDQALKRAQDDSLSLPDSVKAEIEEMNIFLDILSVPSESARVNTVLGVTLVARASYWAAQGETEEEIRSNFMRKLDENIAFLRRMDAKYYDEFRPGREPEDALKLLCEWIRTRVSGFM